MTFLSPHFTVEEMQCPCCFKCNMDVSFMTDLEEMREEAETPLIINSGYRCKVHNALLPNSSPTSWHLQGFAADIKWSHLGSDKKHTLLSEAIRIFDGIGIAKSYMHVDKGGKKKVWVY